MISVGLSAFIMIIYGLGVFIGKLVVGYKPIYLASVISYAITLILGLLSSKKSTLCGVSHSAHFVYHIFMSITWSIFYVYMWSIRENTKCILKKCKQNDSKKCKPKNNSDEESDKCKSQNKSNHECDNDNLVYDDGNERTYVYEH